MEQPREMDSAEYAALSGRTHDAVTNDLASGRLASVRLAGGGLFVAASAVEELFARRKRESAVGVPAEVGAQSTREPMEPDEYARLSGRSVENVYSDLARGAIASVQLAEGSQSRLLVAGSAVDELLHRQANA